MVGLVKIPKRGQKWILHAKISKKSGITQLSISICFKVTFPIWPPAAILDFGFSQIPPPFSRGSWGLNFFEILQRAQIKCQTLLCSRWSRDPQIAPNYLVKFSKVFEKISIVVKIFEKLRIWSNFRKISIFSKISKKFHFSQFFTKNSILVKFLKNFDFSQIFEGNFAFGRIFVENSILLKILENFEKFRFYSNFRKISNLVKFSKIFRFWSKLS